MSNALLGEIVLFAFDYAPQGWAPCQGQAIPISQNVALFSILGASYGGDGRSYFMLPNIPGVVVGAGQGPGRSDYALGESGGEATVALVPLELPQHSHSFNAVTNQATSQDPQGAQLARAWVAQEKTDSVVNFYSPNPANAKTAMSPHAIESSGAGGPHNNMQPSLAVNYCVATQGMMPPRDGAPALPRTPFLGEIAICAFDSPPPGWLLCEGQLLPINQNQALFSLLSTSFGGDGFRSFALPDLRGRVPLGTNENHPFGMMTGQEAHGLTVAEMPAHSHALMGDAITREGIGNTPSNKTVLGGASGAVVPGHATFSALLYSTAEPAGSLAAQTIGNAGGGQPHENRMPSLALSFCICAAPNNAIYPSR